MDSKQKAIQENSDCGPWGQMINKVVQRLPADGGPWGAVERLPADGGPWGAVERLPKDCGPWGDREQVQAQECGPQSALEHLGPWAMVENKEHQKKGGPTCGAEQKRLKTAKATASNKAAKIAGPWGALLDDPDKFNGEYDEVDREVDRRIARERERASSARERAWSAR